MIEVGTSEAHDLGKLTLTLGNVTESISVTGEIAAVQTASSERAATVQSEELNTVAIKGRDLMSYMKLLPGVLDTSTGRETAGGSILGSLTFSGNTGSDRNVGRRRDGHRYGLPELFCPFRAEHRLDRRSEGDGLELFSGERA